eukprot:gene16363-22564_t
MGAVDAVATAGMQHGGGALIHIFLVVAFALAASMVVVAPACLFGLLQKRREENRLNRLDPGIMPSRSAFVPSSLALGHAGNRTGRDDNPDEEHTVIVVNAKPPALGFNSGSRAYRQALGAVEESELEGMRQLCFQRHQPPSASPSEYGKQAHIIKACIQAFVKAGRFQCIRTQAQFHSELPDDRLPNVSVMSTSTINYQPVVFDVLVSSIQAQQTINEHVDGDDAQVVRDALGATEEDVELHELHILTYGHCYKGVYLNKAISVRSIKLPCEDAFYDSLESIQAAAPEPSHARMASYTAGLVSQMHSNLARQPSLDLASLGSSKLQKMLEDVAGPPIPVTASRLQRSYSRSDSSQLLVSSCQPTSEQMFSNRTQQQEQSQSLLEDLMRLHAQR